MGWMLSSLEEIGLRKDLNVPSIESVDLGFFKKIKAMKKLSKQSQKEKSIKKKKKKNSLDVAETNLCLRMVSTGPHIMSQGNYVVGSLVEAHRGHFAHALPFRATQGPLPDESIRARRPNEGSHHCQLQHWASVRLVGLVGAIGKKSEQQVNLSTKQNLGIPKPFWGWVVFFAEHGMTSCKIYKWPVHL